MILLPSLARHLGSQGGHSRSSHMIASLQASTGLHPSRWPYDCCLEVMESLPFCRYRHGHSWSSMTKEGFAGRCVRSSERPSSAMSSQRGCAQDLVQHGGAAHMSLERGEFWSKKRTFATQARRNTSGLLPFASRGSSSRQPHCG